MKSKTVFLNLIILFYGIFFGSCEKDIFTDVAVQPDIQVQNDYLWFRNQKVYDRFMDDYKSSSRTVLDEWEKRLEFTSLRSIYEKAIMADNEYFELLEALSEEELGRKYPNGFNSHAEFVENNSQFFNFSSEGWFELKIPYQEMSKILNREGLVRIGDKIFKYSQDNVKIISDGDEKKIGLLHKIKKTDFNNNIEVNNVSRYRKEIANENNREISSSFQVNSCTDRQDRYRVRLYEDIIVEYYGDANNFKFVHGFGVYSFRHTVQGWQRRFETGDLAGSVSFYASYGSGYEHIQANGPQHSIAWTLYQGTFGSSNKPEIYWSEGKGWGRNGSYCTYQESY